MYHKDHCLNWIAYDRLLIVYLQLSQTLATLSSHLLSVYHCPKYGKTIHNANVVILIHVAVLQDRKEMYQELWCSRFRCCCRHGFVNSPLFTKTGWQARAFPGKSSIPFQDVSRLNHWLSSIDCCYKLKSQLAFAWGSLRISSICLLSCSLGSWNIIISSKDVRLSQDV